MGDLTILLVLLTFRIGCGSAIVRRIAEVSLFFCVCLPRCWLARVLSGLSVSSSPSFPESYFKHYIDNMSKHEGTLEMHVADSDASMNDFNGTSEDAKDMDRLGLAQELKVYASRIEQLVVAQRSRSYRGTSVQSRSSASPVLSCVPGWGSCRELTWMLGVQQYFEHH